MLAEVGGGGVSTRRRRLLDAGADAGAKLITIASLIDRVPNLGGLCRTCEVLGVGDLVRSSIAFSL